MMRKKQFITDDGVVRYWTNEREDGKETLVLLHGLTADHTLFDRQIEAFEQDYRIICWDAPAHGASRPYRTFTYRGAAEALYGILQQERIAQAVFVGQSAGGFVIQTLLKRHPECVKAMAAIGTCPFGLGYYSPSDQWWLRQTEWMARCFPHRMLVQTMAAMCGCTQDTRDNMRRSLSVFSKSELCHLMGLGFGGFLEENCDLHIPCPVLILVGEHDHTGKVMQYCRRWHQRTGYPFRVVPNAAHNANYDNSEFVNRELVQFLQISQRRNACL